MTVWLFDWIRRLISWFRPDAASEPVILPLPLPPQPEPEPELQHVAAPMAEPIMVGAPRAKWVKPKGLELLAAQKPREPRAARAEPRAPRPKQKPEDEEKYGQYYFRDQILDQLDQYFVYLKRLKARARNEYDLHHQLGIHVVPGRTLQTFDDWRFEGTMDELDAWWKENRPAFGAIAYGMDYDSLNQQRALVVDAPPEQWEAWAKEGRECEAPRIITHRIATLTGNGESVEGLNGQEYKAGICWVPKFLIFNKFAKTPPHIQSVVDGDIYSLTVYWDRVDKRSRKWMKGQGKHGGVPQEYAVCVEKATGKVRVLKMLLHEHISMRARRGEHFSIPFNHWAVPIEYLSWAGGNFRASPEEILRRTFIEAAMMYQSASLGSMIRIEASKGNLTATFGVEIKRMAYFFKDRDVTVAALTASGRRKPVFHIVRPHARKTRSGGETTVPMHFSGLKQFEWAGYRINITVPGRDHFHLSEFNVGAHWYDKKREVNKKKMISQGELAGDLKRVMKEGLGAWKSNSGTETKPSSH
jgi:hypothetical protein